MNLSANKTKIVCTIGPASNQPHILDKMLRAGMNIARLNFSHGTFEQHAQTIQNLRDAAARCKIRLAIMADLPGPKMRIGEMEKEPEILVEGDSLILTTREMIGNKGCFSTMALFHCWSRLLTGRMYTVRYVPAVS